jgi:dUTPase
MEEDYQGEINVVLLNNSTIPFQVRPEDRIVELILERILRADPKEMKDSLNIIRGIQGFG